MGCGTGRLGVNRGDVFGRSTSLGFLARTSIVFAAALALTGCPNPNTYGTARTTPPGKLSFTVAPEAWGFRTKVKTVDESGNPTTEEFSGVLPVAPTFQLRLGVVDEVDLGFRVNNLASLGFDSKINFLKGSLDLALDPGIQWYRIEIQTASGANVVDESVNVFYLHGPLLIDINLNESVTFVLSPGVVYGFASNNAFVSDGDADVTSAATADGFFARFGLGFDFRFSKGFALHPEVTAMRSFGDEADLIYMAGLGFNFGKLPSFDDLAGPEAGD